MAYPRILRSVGALASAACVLALSNSAWAVDGPLFLATAHGGMATELGAGATLELRLLSEVCLGGTFDLGKNFYGSRGDYTYLGPAAHGSFGWKLGESFELRPFFGARFPLNLSASDPSKYKIVDNSIVAFTTALRFSYMFDVLLVGLQVDYTPHGVTWEDVASGKREDKTEHLVRASAVVGIALGKPE
jgi:hypothetical protein